MRRAVCPGSFDPLHNGHLDIIERAAGLFDEVIVAVSTNPAKHYRFSAEDRVAMVSEVTAELSGVVVERLDGGLLATFCAERGAVAMVKGLRSGEDFAYEVPMAVMNRQLSGVETVYLASNACFAHVSSSLLKEVHTLGGDVTGLVPPPILARLRR